MAALTSRVVSSRKTKVWLMSCLLNVCLVRVIDVLFAWCVIGSCDWCLVCLMCAWFVWLMSSTLDMCLVRVIDDLFAWCMLGSCDWFNSWILIVYSVCGLSVALCGLIVADCLVNYSNYLNYARYVLQRCLFFFRCCSRGIGSDTSVWWRWHSSLSFIREQQTRPMYRPGIVSISMSQILQTLP